MTQFLYFQENVRPMEILVLKFVSTFTITCMNAAVKTVSSSVQMDITASSKVSYNKRKNRYVTRINISAFYGMSHLEWPYLIDNSEW